MLNALKIFHMAVAILLILTILLQEKGVGLSSAFGGGGEFYRSKRGIDRILFIVTIVLATLFILASIAFVFVK